MGRVSECAHMGCNRLNSPSHAAQGWGGTNLNPVDFVGKNKEKHCNHTKHAHLQQDTVEHKRVAIGVAQQPPQPQPQPLNHSGRLTLNAQLCPARRSKRWEVRCGPSILLFWR